MNHQGCSLIFLTKIGTSKGEGRKMPLLQSQDPRPTPVSDATVSGTCPSRCSERPEYNK
jgi:hypothetical protein